MKVLKLFRLGCLTSCILIVIIVKSVSESVNYSRS